MIYNLAIIKDSIKDDASFKLLLDGITEIVQGSEDLQRFSTILDLTRTRRLIGKPNVNPYKYIGSENGGQFPVDTILWFSKKHPSIESKEVFTGLRLVGNSVSSIILQVVICKSLSDSGKSEDKFAYPIEVSNKDFLDVDPKYQCAKPNLSIGQHLSLFISDYGLGYFACNTSDDPLNCGFSHYNGSLYLEELDTVKSKGAAKGEDQGHFPSIALIYTCKGVRNIVSTNRCIGLLPKSFRNYPEIQLEVPITSMVGSEGIFQTPSRDQDTSIRDSLSQQQVPIPVSAQELLITLHETFLIDPYTGDKLCKLPILRPHKTFEGKAHMGKIIKLKESGKTFIGIQALEDFSYDLTNSSLNPEVIQLKATTGLQCYLRD